MTTAQLHSVREAAQALESVGSVVGYDILEDLHTNGSKLEVSVGVGFERVPPEVLRALSEFDLGVRDVSARPRGTFVVTAV